MAARRREPPWAGSGEDPKWKLPAQGFACTGVPLGTVKSVLDFGAFVDIGAERDGLLHISRISQERIANIYAVLSKGQQVDVWISGKREDEGEPRIIAIKVIFSPTILLKVFGEMESLSMLAVQAAAMIMVTIIGNTGSLAVVPRIGAKALNTSGLVTSAYALCCFAFAAFASVYQYWHDQHTLQFCSKQ
eukprot:s598_g30.t1